MTQTAEQTAVRVRTELRVPARLASAYTATMSIGMIGNNRNDC
jgi:hypothetical protein